MTLKWYTIFVKSDILYFMKATLEFPQTRKKPDPKAVTRPLGHKTMPVKVHEQHTSSGIVIGKEFEPYRQPHGITEDLPTAESQHVQDDLSLFDEPEIVAEAVERDEYNQPMSMEAILTQLPIITEEMNKSQRLKAEKAQHEHIFRVAKSVGVPSDLAERLLDA